MRWIIAGKLTGGVGDPHPAALPRLESPHVIRIYDLGLWLDQHGKMAPVEALTLLAQITGRRRPDLAPVNLEVIILHLE
jgi:hypothetical protein